MAEQRMGEGGFAERMHATIGGEAGDLPLGIEADAHTRKGKGELRFAGQEQLHLTISASLDAATELGECFAEGGKVNVDLLAAGSPNDNRDLTAGDDRIDEEEFVDRLFEESGCSWIGTVDLATSEGPTESVDVDRAAASSGEGESDVGCAVQANLDPGMREPKATQETAQNM